MPPQLVIFDCDGVLVDSEMIASRELAAYITDLGRPTTDAQCRATFTGMSLKSVRELVRQDWGFALPDDFVEQLRKRDHIAFERDLQIIPGVVEVLGQLRALGLDYCVASSGSPEKIHHSLTLTGLLDRFDDNVFSASQVNHGKPAPDLFKFAAFEMGAAATDCIVIEDSPTGVKAGVAAGMTVLGFTGGQHCDAQSANGLLFSGAKFTFNEMSLLPHILGL